MLLRAEGGAKLWEEIAKMAHGQAQVFSGSK